MRCGEGCTILLALAEFISERERSEVFRGSSRVGLEKKALHISTAFSPSMNESFPVDGPLCPHSSSSHIEESAFRKITTINHVYLSVYLSLSFLTRGSPETKP